jgi:hypothetical protein
MLTCSRGARTPEWKKLMDDGAFNLTFMTGDDYAMGRERRKRMKA